MNAEQYRQKLSTALEEAIEQENWAIAAHDALASVLAGWKGKKLNRRVLTQFQDKFMPDIAAREKAVFYWRDDYGMLNVELWGIGPWTDHGKRLSMSVAYHSQPTEPRLVGAFVGNYDPASFEYADNCHGNAAKERNVQRKSLLSDTELLDRLASLVEQANTALEAIEAVTEYGQPAFQAKYIVSDMLKG
jgi:hypothetical protein